jgi:hypothetical protein
MGTRKPDGYGFGQNLKPVMGMGFLMGIDIFHGYGFGTAKPSGFVPVAISTDNHVVRHHTLLQSPPAISFSYPSALFHL